MKPRLWQFALWGAVGCALGGLLAELLLPIRDPVRNSTPQNIALVLDTSGSMDDAGKLEEVKRASSAFVDRQDLERVGMAVVGFDSSAEVVSDLSHDEGTVKRALSSLRADGATNMADGLRRAQATLVDTASYPPDEEPPRVPMSLLLFTDGLPTDENGQEAGAQQATLEAALSVRNSGIRLIAIATEDADRAFLEQVTGDPALVFSTSSGNFGDAFGRAERAISGLYAGSGGSSVWAVLWDALARSALVALGLGAVLLLALNALTLRGRLTRDLGWVPFGAALLGAAGGLIGQLLFSAGSSRALGWSLMGAGAGLFLGLADRSRTLALRGALGGALGGLIGGGFFQSFGGEGAFARLVGFAVLGAAVGLMVILAQQIFKGAWLYGLSTGPYEGKEYILAKPTVTVGRSDRNDIGLYREQELALEAGQLAFEHGGWRWKGDPLEVNGVLQKDAPLRSGDRLRLGRTEFMFQVRGAPPTEAFAPQSTRTLEGWMLHDNQQAYALGGASATVGLEGGALSLGSSKGVLRLSTAGEHLRLEPLGPGVQVNGVNVPGPLEVRAGDLLTLEGREVALLRR